MPKELAFIIEIIKKCDTFKGEERKQIEANKKIKNIQSAH
jgi:hypothetical protein